MTDPPLNPRPPEGRGASPSGGGAGIRRHLPLILKGLILLELFGAVFQGAAGNGWSRLGIDLVAAGILYLLWGRILRLMREKKEEYRIRMERAGEKVRLWDALVFSLLWTDEIHRDLPPDRRRIADVSYVLIGLGVVVAFSKPGEGLMPLVVSGALVLAAVNLLGWVVARERGERETLATELRLAREVQVALMSSDCPSLAGYDVAGMSLPAEVVGGDHYGCRLLDARRMGISLFDVSGKGMQAAMSAVFTSGAFASEAGTGADPALVLTAMNAAVRAHWQRGRFVTFLYGVLESGVPSLTFANAGQPRPLLRSGGGVRELESAGPTFPLGMTEQASYEARSVRLAPGDVLVFLTDGFTDAMDPAGEPFGTERLSRALAELPAGGMTARAVADELTSAVRRHAGDAPQHDDMTMVVVRVLPPA
ncbi:MAG: PP2C family protein-serine/threonine phosphatase [Bacteroidota bacterium]